MLTCLTLAIGLHLATDHGLAAGHRFSDVNPGAYVRCDRNVVGVFHNSVRRNSAYVARLFPVSPNVDLAVGVATGYAKSASPLVALQFRSGKYRMSFIPTTPMNRGGMHLTVEF